MTTAPFPKRRSKLVALPRVPRTNLGAPLAPFIGRRAVLERIDAALDGGARLVTLLGPPGIGKTRVAQRVVELRTPLYGDGGGSWFCDLREVRDAAGLARAVASLWPSLDAAQMTDEDLRAQLPEHLLVAGPMLLVLDNFEQIVPAAPRVRSWCEAAPELRVLVTSRQRLAVPGEILLELGPMECPRPGDPPQVVLATEAVQLLRERVVASAGELGDDPAVLGALARQLDGIPLALELAAARTRLMRPSDLAARLEQSFVMSLASAIDWSWNLLPAREQRALAECSVFVGGFTVDAAEHVLGDDAGDGRSVDIVSALRDKSLLHLSGDGRLGMFVSIREYAAARLEALGEAPATAIRLRHARHYGSRVRVFNEARTFRGAEPDAALRIELTAERENLIAAVATFRRQMQLEARDVAALAELAIGLTLLHGPPTLCHDTLAAALQAIDHAGNDASALRVRLLLARQGLLNTLGRFAESRADLDHILSLDPLPPAMRALTLAMRGIQLRYQSLYRLAWDSHVEAEKALAPLDVPRMKVMNWACMGRLQGDFGDERLARELNGRARSLSVEMGDFWTEGLTMANLAQLDQEHQRFEVAARQLEQALSNFRRASEPHYVAVYSAAMGDVLFEWDRLDEARDHYAEAETFLAAWIAHRSTALMYAAWAALEARCGDLPRAEGYLERARRCADRQDSASVQLVVELQGASLDLLREPGARQVRRWAERLRAVEAGEQAALSLDVRFAVRILRRALGAPAPEAGRVLRLGPAARWFALDDGEHIDLQRRAALRRILEALARQHAAHPDLALDHDTLLAHGWPGERLLPEAAGTRLRVAIATLRRLGLRDVILTRDDGYVLDAATRLDPAHV